MNFLRFFVVFLAMGCTTNESVHEKLKGHWHATEPLYNIKTLDIYDSVSISDQYSLLGYDRVFFLYDSEGVLTLPDLCCGETLTSCVREFHVSNDTLVYDTSLYGACSVLKFVKSDIQKCKWTHVLEQSLISFSKFPVQTKRLSDWDSLKKNSSLAPILVGTPKKPSDSNPRISIYDVYVTFDDIPMYAVRALASATGTGNNAAVLLIIDESVPKAFADSLVAVIPKADSLKLFRLVKAKNSEELGYERIN
jgi:hypothetical protein